MILAILAIIFGYRKARDTGRNGVLWGAICGLAFVGSQILVSFGAGMFIGIGAEFWGWSESLYDDLAWPITIAAIIVSVLVLLLIFRYLDRVPPDEPGPPPPPPSFEQSDQTGQPEV